MSQNPDPITPKELFLSRRQFLTTAGFVGAGVLLASCAPGGAVPSTFTDAQTDFEKATNYNNYYEFSLSKNSVAELSKDFTASPWQIEVTGLVNKPLTLTMEDVLSSFKQEERVYRMRCVEGWSMVLPWQGFSLNKLLNLVEPAPEAKFVSFESVLRPEQMPGQQSLPYPWPYLEGLRLDEAMHNLTILATGLYDEPLTPQNGAPIRLVVPWKYGFKSLKAITKIKIRADMPPTFWSSIGPQEYGFYANVNPDVDHPRWSQATELRMGDSERRPTLMFNGYNEVSSLYDGMDLTKNY
ncbi:MAG: protein-methionine-sulfoxide reductase catalytic subunit MsrP [Anaerolineaceae bacterium]